MRILFLDDAVFDDLPGGSRMVARELAQGLARRGHDVTFLVPRHGSELPDDIRQDGMRIVRYGGAGQFIPFVTQGRAAAARLWAETPFDVVHTHFAYAALGPLQVIPARVPRIRTFHGSWAEEGWVEDCAHTAAQAAIPGWRRAALKARNRLVRMIRHRVEADNIRHSDRVIVLSEQSRQDVRAYGYPDSQMTQIVGGVDLARFMPQTDRQSARQSVGLPADKKILLSVRRLMARMGLDILIDAMPAVVARHPDVLLVIGGKGPEQQSLARRITQHGLDDHVQLVGYIADEQLPLYYQAADVFVLPTLALEGFGLVTIESLASGIPVIGTPVGATPEILTRLDARLVAQEASAAGLARVILSFLEEDWRQGLTPARLMEFARDHYTWDQNVLETERLYQSLLDKPS